VGVSPPLSTLIYDAQSWTRVRGTAHVPKILASRGQGDGQTILRSASYDKSLTLERRKQYNIGYKKEGEQPQNVSTKKTSICLISSGI
jgi:hypothetical protein